MANMARVLMLVVFSLLPVIGEGEMSIRFDPSSVLPANGDVLKDNSSETCTQFKLYENTTGPQYTKFRIRSYPIDVGDINVTIAGSNLGCGYNLYVSPLSPADSEQWLGRWKACQLEDKTIYGYMERCLYLCKAPGHCKEIQILKVPRHLDESVWEICQINITANTSGERINLAMTPGTTCTASSRYTKNLDCSHATDGNLNPGEGNAWASGKTTPGEWIQIKFPSLVGVEQLEVWHSCKIQAQARIIELAFSYDATFQVNGLCDGADSSLTCVGKRFSLYDFSPAVVTQWVRLTCIVLCVPNAPRYFGLIEVKAFGRFMGK